MHAVLTNRALNRALLESRRAVRISLMRSTIHLVTARDCLAIRPVLQPSMERRLYSATPFGRGRRVSPLRRLSAPVRRDLEREAEGLLELLARGTPAKPVRLE